MRPGNGCHSPFFDGYRVPASRHSDCGCSRTVVHALSTLVFGQFARLDCPDTVQRVRRPLHIACNPVFRPGIELHVDRRSRASDHSLLDCLRRTFSWRAGDRRRVCLHDIRGIVGIVTRDRGGDRDDRHLGHAPGRLQQGICRGRDLQCRHARNPDSPIDCHGRLCSRRGGLGWTHVSGRRTPRVDRRHHADGQYLRGRQADRLAERQLGRLERNRRIRA